MSHDTFYICPHCDSLVDLLEVQWTCGEGHIITRAKPHENPKPGRKYAITYQGSLLIVGKATEQPGPPIGDPLNRRGDYAIVRNGCRQLDKFGVLHDCPLCGTDAEVTLYQCASCRRPVRPEQVAVHHIQYAPTGMAAANLVLQREGGPKEAQWVA